MFFGQVQSGFFPLGFQALKKHLHPQALNHFESFEAVGSKIFLQL